MRIHKKLYLALNKIADGFSYIDSRLVTCGSEHAYRLPMGKCPSDIEKRIDALVAAVGAPVELIDRGGAVIVRVVEKDYPKQLKFKESDLKYDRLLMGYDRLFNPVYFKLMHLLIGGASGGGKTMELRFLLYQLIRMSATIKIVDMKKYSFLPFEIFRNVEVAKNLEDAADMLHEAMVELDRREDMIVRARDRSLTDTFKPYVVIVDEAAFIAPKTYSGKAKGFAQFCDDTCGALSQKGRESKVFLLYCTQKPNNNIVNGQVKANVEGALGFRTNYGYESKVILGETGAERISIATPGRCIFRGDRIYTMQTPFIGEKDWEWDAFLAPLKVEVLHHGSSQRSEPQRVYIDLPDSSPHSNNQTTLEPEQFARSAKESVQGSKGDGKGKVGGMEIPRSREDLVSHKERQKVAAGYTDEVPD
ncbi:hypothetical protein SD71_10860 [Cohnella kolymensis]|uniref:FtsK domain-containing protein n=1 Tax=Cohnella kolymensis TaxID=1590652 RepID=A0ABR5A4A6_9BACL|nr:hypothetical protein [Cohnella kolymensis]KIL35881.1 hypothetical protein SD71_10860 [Cohnella kolymensis]